MSSVWSRLEALRASQRRRGRSGATLSQRCPCGHCGWVATEGGGRESRGFPDDPALSSVFLTLSHLLSKHPAEDASRFDNPDYINGKFRHDAQTMVGLFLFFLGDNSSYPIPEDVEREAWAEQYFGGVLEELMGRLVQANLHPHSSWPDFLAMASEVLSTDSWSLEKLVRHHDPRLQLIHLSSFRCFVELQYLRLYIGHYLTRIAAAIAPAEDLPRLLHCMTSMAECVVFYAEKLGLDIPAALECHCARREQPHMKPFLPPPTLWRKPKKDSPSPVKTATSGRAQSKPAFEDLSAAAPKEGLSKGQRKRRARAAAKASRAPARPRSPSGTPSEESQSSDEEEASKEAFDWDVGNQSTYSPSARSPVSPSPEPPASKPTEEPPQTPPKTQAPVFESLEAKTPKTDRAAKSPDVTSKLSLTEETQATEPSKSPVKPEDGSAAPVGGTESDWAHLARCHARLLRRLRAASLK